MAIFAKHHGCTELYQLSAKLGPGWAYRYAQDIYDADQYEAEHAFNEKHGIQAPEYKDETIKRAKERKQSREKTLMKKLELHSKTPVNIEEKRKVERAKQAIAEWIAKGVIIEDESSTVHGQCGIEHGMLVMRTGERSGEVLF